MHVDSFLSTEMVDDVVRDDFWRDLSSLIYEVSPNARGSRLEGSVRSRLFGSLVIGNTSFNDQYCRRTPGIIARTDLDLFLLQLVVEGEYRGNFDGTDLHARPGDLFILDLTRVLDSHKAAGSRITVALPRKLIHPALARRKLHGLVLRRNVATNHLLFEFVRSLDRVLDDLPSHEVPPLQEALMGLVNAAISGAPIGPVHEAAVSLALRQRVIDYVNQHLTDPDLSPKRIMQRFRLSHSHLYRVFDSDQGVARLIRNKRLDLAYRTLLRQQGPVSIKELAYQSGFSERSQFSRFFRERFGLAPRELAGAHDAAERDPESSAMLHRYLVGQVRQVVERPWSSESVLPPGAERFTD